MATESYFTLREKKLNNHCPECYSSNGLQLVFKQKFKETPFYKAVTEDIINEMHCGNCDTQIFPVRWTEDIEQVVAYQMRAVKAKSKSYKLKPLAWFIIITDILLVAGIILYATGII